MKITAEHREQLADILNAIDEATWNAAPTDSEYLEAGNTLKRARWDRLWVAGRIPAQKDAVNNWWREVYQYANDSHVDTALRDYFNHRA